jgi:hypothetical protein
VSIPTASAPSEPAPSKPFTFPSFADVRSGAMRVRTPLITYAFSRIVLAVVIGMMRIVRPGQGFDGFATGWDASWYTKVVYLGYPSVIPPGTGNEAQSTLAFFPFYPRLAQWTSQIGPYRLERSMWLINIVLGAIAIVVWWKLVERHFGAVAANSVAAVLSFFPGSYVFSMGYSEPLFLCLVGASLLALDSKHWWRAGLWCALAGLARPNAVALMAAIGIVALVELWDQRREGRLSLASARGPVGAMVLAPVGMAAFFTFLWQRTGKIDAWFSVQRRGWGQSFDFGKSTANALWDLAHHPFLYVMDLVNGVFAAFMIVAAVVLVRSKVPLAWKVYGLGVAVLALGSDALLSTPRFALAGAPLIIAVTLPLSSVGRERLVSACAIGLTFITWVVGTTVLYVP